MKGLSIVVPDQDFSGSPLGTVTIIHSPSQRANAYVNAYSTAIGSSAYNNALNVMFNAICQNELDLKLKALYPMLGDTLTKVSVNALNPSAYSLSLGVNASVGAKGVSFTNDICVGLPDIADIPVTKASYFVVFDSSWVKNSGSLFGPTKKDYVGGHVTVSKANDPNVGGKHFYISIPGGDQILFVPSVPTDIVSLCFTLEGSTFKATFNNSETQELVSTRDFNRGINTGLGYNSGLVMDGTAIGVAGETSTSSQIPNLWDGNSYFYAIGELTMEENIALKGIVKTFLQSVKEITIA